MKWEILKGSEKDFEGAPEWAMHVVKLNRDSAVAWVSGGDDKYQYKYEHEGQDGYPIHGAFISWDWRNGVEIIAERRPITEPDVNQQVTTEWDGTGIARLGQHLEYFWGEGKEWRKAEVVAHYEESPLLKDIEDGLMVAEINNKMRPIRSPEDVARDNAVNDMAQIIECLTGCSPKPLAGWLYDAGYRKVE